jgi:hypothetical protein
MNSGKCQELILFGIKEEHDWLSGNACQLLPRRDF